MEKTGVDTGLECKWAADAASQYEVGGEHQQLVPPGATGINVPVGSLDRANTEQAWVVTTLPCTYCQVTYWLCSSL